MVSPSPASNYDEFFRKEYLAMVALGVAFLGDVARAEDLAQEALLRALRSWPTVAVYDKPGAWLRRVMINLCSSEIGARRRDRARVELVARERGTSAAAGFAGLDRAATDEIESADPDLWNGVRRLPPQQRAAVVLRYVGDLPIAEIAEVLGCAPGTVKAHLHKARRSLGRALDVARSREQTTEENAR